MRYYGRYAVDSAPRFPKIRLLELSSPPPKSSMRSSILLPFVFLLTLFAAPELRAQNSNSDSPTGTVTSPDAQKASEVTAQPEAATKEDAGPQGFEKQIDEAFGWLLGKASFLPFYNLNLGAKALKDEAGKDIKGPNGKDVIISVPVVVVWLVIAAIFFTIMFRFVNFRLFGHAIQVVRGKYTDPNAAGEVTHFQALASALSATVGLGNIAGVAIAVSLGGPGATFWMICAGLLGMSLKFAECTLGQKYRQIDSEGRVSGGPMHYLKDGLADRGFAKLGIVLSVMFTLFCIGGSLAGGNSFQVNSSLKLLAADYAFFNDNGYIYGLIMATMVGIVIIGGIKRIAQTAEKIVPLMCGIYVAGAILLLLSNMDKIPGAFGAIFGGAFNAEAMYGGAIGALVTGFKRAAFSNEAGVGSAAIAHSAAKTDYPVREGIVALLEPFIDTVVVCTMTALVIVISGVYNAPEHAHLIINPEGAALTGEAFKTVPWMASWFPKLLLLAVIMFAFSTMISWSYYGERCWTHLFGQGASMAYKILFLVFVVLGSIVRAQNVLDFGDLMILVMAFPNILGLYFLKGFVTKDLQEYESELQAGNFKTFK